MPIITLMVIFGLAIQMNNLFMWFIAAMAILFVLMLFVEDDRDQL